MENLVFFQEHSIQISPTHHAITLTQPTQGHIFVGTLFSRKLAFFLEREKKVQKVLFVANNKEGGGIAKKPSK